MLEVLTAVDQLTPDRLTELLRADGALPRGRVLEVQQETDAREFSQLVHLTLAYSPDAPEAAPRSLLAKLARYDREYAGYETFRESESHFYRHLAPSISAPPLVRCYAVAYSPEQRCGHLLLEDVSATHGVPKFPEAWPLPPPYAMFEQIVDALTVCQAAYWDHPQLATLPGGYPGGACSPLSTQNGAAAYTRFAEQMGDRLAPGTHRLFERILAAYPALDHRMSARQHLTITHGDFIFGNVLLPNDPQRDTVRIIDWELCTVNLGAFDLAEILSLHWDAGSRCERERDLVERYHAGLQARGVGAYSWEQCWYDYRLALLNHLFTPVQQWADRHWPGSWWGRLERTVKRVGDLGCEELLAAAGA